MTTRRHWLVVLCVAALGTVAAACVPAKNGPPPPPPPGPQLPPPPPALTASPAGSPQLSQQLVLGGLDTPWDIAFVPGTGTMLFTEKRPGLLSRIDENGAKQTVGSVPIHDVEPTGSEGVDALHAGHKEAGLLGVAVHPDFPTSPWLYLCYTTDIDVRVQRYVLDNTEWTIDATSQPAVTGIPFGEIHHGCRIRFQPGTGHLFITTGDAKRADTPQDVASTYGGKVLRVDENLAPVPGNPGVGVSGYDDRIYTFGHRNVQGLAFGPGGHPYTSEHGTDVNDEVNSLVAGGNGGWQAYVSPGDPYDETAPMTDLARFPDAMQPVWRSGDFGTLAPSGMDFLSGPQWGSWDGALAVAFLKGRQLMIMFLNADGTINSTWSEFEIGGLKSNGVYPRLRGATLGPDGSLYVATDAPVEALGDNFPGEIWKITPTAGT